MLARAGGGFLQEECVAAAEAESGQTGPEGGGAEEEAGPAGGRRQHQGAEGQHSQVEHAVAEHAAEAGAERPGFRNRPGREGGGRERHGDGAVDPAADARLADEDRAHGAADHQGKARDPARPAEQLARDIGEDGAGRTEQVLHVGAGGGVPARIGRQVGADAAADEDPCSERGRAREDPPDRIAHRAQLFVSDVGVLHEGKRSGVGERRSNRFRRLALTCSKRRLWNSQLFHAGRPDFAGIRRG